jgi:hypothetical protein
MGRFEDGECEDDAHKGSNAPTPVINHSDEHAGQPGPVGACARPGEMRGNVPPRAGKNII